MLKSTLKSRFQGGLFGIAIGDALGAAVEFKKPGTFPLVTEFRGGGPFNIPAGYWTDDTSMALCLATSLRRKNTFDPLDQIKLYSEWYTDGRFSSTGTCFDIGITTREAIMQFAATNKSYSSNTDPNAAGNGSLMRLLPIPLVYYKRPYLAKYYAELSSKVTHPTKECLEACNYFSELICRACNSAQKEEICSPIRGKFSKNIQEIIDGSYKRKQPPTIIGSGYVVKSLEAALWAFYTTKSYEEAVLKAVNLGDDSDTTGAICGQLAGVYYGIDGIPKRWKEAVTQPNLLQEVANQLLETSATIKIPLLDKVKAALAAI